mgnify:CR=1 FL=1
MATVSTTTTLIPANQEEQLPQSDAHNPTSLDKTHSPEKLILTLKKVANGYVRKEKRVRAVQDEEQTLLPDERVEKKQKAAWNVGDRASVCLHKRRGFSYFRFCHTDGELTSVSKSSATICILGDKEFLTVRLDELSPIRPADTGVQWTNGDQVHVLQTIDGIASWWEAEILGPTSVKGEWRIKWAGEYETYDDEVTVTADLIRRAVTE